MSLKINPRKPFLQERPEEWKNLNDMELASKLIEQFTTKDVTQITLVVKLADYMDVNTAFKAASEYFKAIGKNNK